MSTFSSYTLPDLYCHEAADEFVPSGGCKHLDHLASSYSSFDNDNDFVVTMFDSEVDQTPEPKLLERLRLLPDVVTSRREAVQWILKVQNFHMLRPETAYLSVNYLDRFLYARGLPQGKEWSMQLLSVACVSLAAKMGEREVPLLLDLQIKESKFLFKPITVQKMELLVMATLKWQLRTITPFDFVHHFITEISCLHSQEHSFTDFFSRTSDLITTICTDIDFLNHRPSTIAAAAVLLTADCGVEDQKLGCIEKVNREMLKKCHNLLRRKLSDHLLLVKQQKLELLPPPSPTGFLDTALDEGCNRRNLKSME
ncbi:hypothetical protein SLE2022_300640 [Rubroshorea leprosula]